MLKPELKAELKAEHIEVETLSPIAFDRIVVAFNDGVTRARIDELNAMIGAFVPPKLYAGVNWAVRLLPIKRNQMPSDSSKQLRSAAHLAIQYAADTGADVIHASFGVFYVKGADSCEFSISGLGSQFGAKLAALQQEGASFKLGNAIIVTPVGNCDLDIDREDILAWPAELSPVRVISVGCTVTNSNPIVRYRSGAHGPSTTMIAAPATNFNVSIAKDLLCGGISGTSVAGPLVAGAIGLMLAHDPSLIGDPTKITNRLLCNATVAPALALDVGGGGRFLNIADAVSDAKHCAP